MTIVNITLASHHLNILRRNPCRRGLSSGGLCDPICSPTSKAHHPRGILRRCIDDPILHLLRGVLRRVYIYIIRSGKHSHNVRELSFIQHSSARRKSNLPSCMHFGKKSIAPSPPFGRARRTPYAIREVKHIAHEVYLTVHK